jgi:hypothetical protein
MKLYKLLLAVVGATVLFGALATTASARSLSTTATSITATFASAEFTGLFGTTRCALTLEGTQHSRTIAKSPGSLIGFITRARLGACANGAATLLTETLPWHVQYGSFAGTLPRITSFTTNVVGSAFRVRETGGITCLVRSTAGEPSRGIYNRNTTTGAITSATLGGSIRSGGECFNQPGTLGGTSNSITANTVTLI